MFAQHPKLEKSATFTRETLDTVREELAARLANSPYAEMITLISTGSYGRGEATPESDMDWYMILNADQVPSEVIPDELKAIVEVITRAAPNGTGETGTFGADACVRFSDMLSNIGGENDDNKSFTRRMLFLLEGTWLYGEERFIDYRRQLLEKYLREDSPEGQVPHFFLNDIIRYYRTIATDFEYKVTEAKRSWGLRKTKLLFSRKLLYFGGLVTVAEVTSLPYQEKLNLAGDLFAMPVLQRIESLGNEHADTNSILTIYEQFSARMANAAVRSELDALKREDRAINDQYQQLKRLSEEFSRALVAWLQAKYPANHPIHHAMLF